MQQVALTVFQGRAGDRNALAMAGAQSLGSALEKVLGASPYQVAQPELPLDGLWELQLQAARPALQALQERIDQVLSQGLMSIALTSRCAASIATLPAVARHRPDACVVWFDAHADLHTPETTTSGYLGGMALSGPLGLWNSGLGAGLLSAQVIEVGQRDMDPPEQALLDAGVVTWIPPGPLLAQRLQAAIGGRPVYMHLDCDVLEPGFVPTEYQVPGGLTLSDLQACCEVIASAGVVGLEIAEFQNTWQEGGATADPTELIQALAPLWRHQQT